MDKPRILFLDQSGELGGAELYLLDVARPYSDTSRVVLFDDGPFYERLSNHSIPADVLSAPSALLDVKKDGALTAGLRALPGVVTLTKDIARRARDFDVVFANSQKSLVVGGPASYLAGRPLIWNLHDMLTADHFSTFHRYLAVQSANIFADRIVVNSRATKSAFAHSGGQIPKTDIVYNGIDPTPFEAVDSPAGVLRSELGLPSAPLVGVFSRLAPWKGQHVLLEALPALPDVHVLLVGDSLFRGDEPYERELRRTARGLGVQDRVHFLGFRDDIPRLMKAVDIVAHTSTAPEPFGRVIVEGMLAERPVIASRAGGAKEIVEHGRTGLLTSPGDFDELASAVERILDNPEEARRIGAAGRRSALERFSRERMITDLSVVIEDVAAK